MRFAHLADCHIGSWRDPLLENLSTEAFSTAIDRCIGMDVDFVLIAGDLFNTSLPGIDKLKEVTIKLKMLKDRDIPCYLIAGSHDFSPSGKTMLDVLENAGLCINVAKGEETEDAILKLRFTVDKNTGAKIVGLLGKKGGLEKEYYELLDRTSLEEEPGYKIFLFHSLLTELKPRSLEKVDSQPLSLLPKNFDYYAGGHPHIVCAEKIEGYGTISYPGPLFPNNFRELEELKHGSFNIVEGTQVSRIPVILHEVESFQIDVNHKLPEEVNTALERLAEDHDVKDKIVTLRLSGVLLSGKPSDIDFKAFFSILQKKGAFAVLKNASAMTSKEFEEISVDMGDAKEVEDKLIKQHIRDEDLPGMDPVGLAKELMRTLDDSKDEGETIVTFEKRIKGELENLTRIN